MSASLEDKLKFYRKIGQPSLVEHLGIELESLLPDKVTGRMPVDERTKQPFGVLHGGASVAFAETLASVGGWLNIDFQKSAVAGLEINANHLKTAIDGFVFGEAQPIHIGKTTQVWGIEIKNESKELVSISRCTLAIIDQNKLPSLGK